jgi:hypothetical protein
MNPEPGVRPFFPPEVVVRVKALARELPAQTNLPLSRFSRQDLAKEVIARGIVAQISGATIWRWLDQDAIRRSIPWSGCAAVQAGGESRFGQAEEFRAIRRDQPHGAHTFGTRHDLPILV